MVEWGVFFLLCAVIQQVATRFDRCYTAYYYHFYSYRGIVNLVFLTQLTPSEHQSQLNPAKDCRYQSADIVSSPPPPMNLILDPGFPLFPATRPITVLTFRYDDHRTGRHTVNVD